jgi:hypothetical protein
LHFNGIENFMRFAFPFFWQPKGTIPSLADLPVAGSVLAKNDVTLSVSGKNSSTHPLTVVELAGGKIIGDARLVATAEDVVVGGLQNLFGCAEPQSHYTLRRRRFRMPKFRRGTALLLGAPNGDNYYHWLLDSVPRWKILQAANFLDYNFVLLPSRPVKYQDEILDRLNVPPAKRLRCGKNFVHQFEKLVVPAMPFPVEAVPAWACVWLRTLFPEKISGPEKIYLSRRGAGGRRLINEAELQMALETRGFVSLQPEKLSVAEQAKLLSSARCVVAPHGAALTNLVFAPPGALLFELFHPQHKNNCYVNLAAAGGQRYASLDGTAINHVGDQKLEYAVDVSAVLETLGRNLI